MSIIHIKVNLTLCVESPLSSQLRHYLNLYWLRPENGLLMAFKSKAYDKLKFESPSLDLSCGDGLFQAIHLGAEFDEDFDYFKSTKAREFSHKKFVDIYDHFDPNYEVKFVKKPDIQIDYGADWKQALLDKAKKTGLFKNLLLHDNNRLPLPFDDNQFKTIYSNSVYWIENVEGLIKDLYRITQPGGTVGLELLTPYLLETLDEYEEFLSPEAISILNRQRRETMPGLKDYGEWKEIIENTGFTIEEASSTYPDKRIVDIWNVGLRPISHLLIQMAENLSPDERIKIKHEWVDIFYELFKPLLKLPLTYSLEKAPYLYFQLKK
jgi:SAM-dependent methyltransferase